jgi:hypothetical protein
MSRVATTLIILVPAILLIMLIYRNRARIQRRFAYGTWIIIGGFVVIVLIVGLVIMRPF